MKDILGILTFLRVSVVVGFDARLPLLHPQPGVLLRGHPESQPVHLEVFLDLNCKDSKTTWTALKELSAVYGENLDVVIQQFPLPYHTFAFMLTQGYFLIHDRAPASILNYTELVFDHMDTFSNKMTLNATMNGVISHLANLQEEVTGVDSTEFRNDIHNYRRATVKIWKYGAAKGVYGTPWFFLNGMDLNMDPGNPLDLKEWKILVGKLIEKPIPKSANFAFNTQSVIPNGESSSRTSGSKNLIFLFFVGYLIRILIF